MAFELVRVSKIGAGHWLVLVERDNYSRNGAWRRLTSTTHYRYVTTDSMAVDDYQSEDDRRSRKGAKALIRQARWWGDKFNTKI